MPCRINLEPGFISGNEFNQIITHRSVPVDSFPYITGYATAINRLNNKKLEQRDLMDIVNSDLEYNHYSIEMINDNINMDRLNFGIINSEFGGYGQYILEFDIWNNEPAVTYGFTKTIFEDAENCKVYINDINFNKLHDNRFNFEIRDVLKNEKFHKLNDYKILSGNFNPNNIGCLNGRTDHCKFQISLELIKFNKLVCKDRINFNVCFEYETKHTILDFDGSETKKVKLNFPCEILITNKNIDYDIINKGNGRGCFTGKLEGLNIIQNNYPTTIINIKKNNEYTLYDKYIIQNDIYECFLPKGIYNFEIICNNVKHNFNNIKICNGINFYYSTIEWGHLYKIIDDTFEIINNKERIRMVMGTIFNEYNNFLDNAEIIISSFNKLLMYQKVDSNGNYRFVLPKFENYSNVSIRIRSNNKTVKIVDNFKYDPNKGFIEQLRDKNNSFIHGFSFKEV